MPVSAVILTRPRFPENIGMAARACANFGINRLILVAPELWLREKAEALATPQAKAVLDSIVVVEHLADALAPFSLAYGTTARTGGWRTGIVSPAGAAAEIAALGPDDGEVALVFGPEDTGLENSEIEQCTRLVSIPTMPDASSLNLAQAVLLMVYECFKAGLDQGVYPRRKLGGRKNSPPASLEEMERLFEVLKTTLIGIDFLPEENPEWFMLPLRRFFRRSGLRRHEVDLFMGICRRINRLAPGKDREEAGCLAAAAAACRVPSSAQGLGRTGDCPGPHQEE